MVNVYPELQSLVFTNKHNTKTIDFANPKAVKALNKALLFKYYNVRYWSFPDVNLCPPIPSRVDYIHHLSDLLKINKTDSDKITVLDIGTGASCIYPLLGHSEYKWSFIATDIEVESLKNAQIIIDKNKLNDFIKLRHQSNSHQIFKGIITKEDKISMTMCNPPFYKSEMEALEATTKKLKGLNKETSNIVRNFSGTHNELWYEGGEKAFIHNYLYESSCYKTQCIWFTILVSKKDLVKGIYASLNKLGATLVKTINMSQGHKISRIIAWTFK